MCCWRWMARRALALLLAAAWFVLADSGAWAAAPGPVDGPETGAPALRLCRFGFDGLGDIAPFDVTGLRAGWYVNWQADLSPLRPGGMDYAFMIHFRDENRQIRPNLTGAALAARVKANPGSVWIVGNEPDRSGYQDGLLPAQYAQLYHDIYVQIKAADPTARVAAGSIVQPSPLRLQYLDLVLDAYRRAYGAALPADIWNIHAFILNEQSCAAHPDSCWGAEIPPGVNADQGLVLRIDDNANLDYFKGFIAAFRQWMTARGYRNRPLMISEYGVQMPFFDMFPTARVNAYMNATFDYLSTAADAATGYPADGNRLVQRWAWYSLSDDTMNGWLFAPTSAAATAFGENYAAYTARVAPTVNLQPVGLWPGTPPQRAGEPVMLSLRLTNTGEAGANGPIIVRFYDGDPAAGGAQIGPDQSAPALNGCAETAVVRVTWPAPPPGLTRVWAVVDPANAITETDESDNVLSARILTVASAATFLPLTANAAP